MEVYFIRHGQSEANLKGIIQGHADFPLSSLGKKQAVMVADYLSSVHIDALYSSDLSRAYDTALAIADGRTVKVSPWEMVREVALGPFEGISREQLIAQYPQFKTESLLTSGMPGTEPFESITARCRTTIDFLLKHHHSDRVAVVSHGGFISILLMYLMLKDQWFKAERPFIIGNTGMTLVEIDATGKSKVHYVNKQTHLEHRSGLLSSAVRY